ncbi:hypothetical protein EBGED10_59120 [Bacillus sp. GeD10]|nr:hypothetical protein EBGED10_59120 [Bacillus sp. GeD10]
MEINTIGNIILCIYHGTNGVSYILMVYGKNGHIFLITENNF